MSLVSIGRSSVGRVRTLNEDAWYAGEQLFVVADGMGGHRCGDVASTLTIDTVRSLDREDVSEDEVRQVVRRANAAVLGHSAENPEAAGLGTTLCGAIRRRDDWLVFNVGDSRCYLLTSGSLRQVTVDHSEVQEMVDRGLISRDEARVHPDRNVITRAIGQVPPPEVDIVTLRAGDGGTLLVCSDGLPSEVSDADIAGLCSGDPPLDRLAEELVAAAEAAGGHDNITVVLVTDATDAPVVRPERARTTLPRDLVIREVAQ